jgi:hypothetical protein
MKESAELQTIFVGQSRVPRGMPALGGHREPPLRRLGETFMVSCDPRIMGGLGN